ncbi:signal peptidase I [Mycoplasmatota bacterium]|nr:signal peptidase I [Mycoplasmatota bacterium]
MEKKIIRMANRMLVFSILILVIDLFNSNLVAEFYSLLVYVLGLSGIIISLILRYFSGTNLIKQRMYELIDTISVVWTFFLVFYAVTSFVAYPAKVNGSSMEPNYKDKDIIFIWHLALQPDRFDVVFVNVSDEDYFHPSDEYFLKRIIGLPGERVDYIDNDLYIDGKMVETDFLTNTMTNDFTFEEVCIIKNKDELCNYNVIPKDYYFVLGDNRSNSTDSRRIGLVHKSDIFGKTIFNLSKVVR